MQGLVIHAYKKHPLLLLKLFNLQGNRGDTGAYNGKHFEERNTNHYFGLREYYYHSLIVAYLYFIVHIEKECTGMTYF